MSIHPTAIIDPNAKIAGDVEIEAYAMVGPDVEIGSGSWVGPHAVLRGPTRIGKNNQIFQFSSVGEATQDKKFKGEVAYLEIGDDNVIREFVTLNRGTSGGGGVTRIGNGNLFMAYVHVAHDCIIGNNNIFANCTQLAGHVEIGDYVGFGGFAGAHQFCKVGSHSYIAKSTVIGKDVLPYVLVAGADPKSYGLNLVGLKRRGFPSETIAVLKDAYKTICRKGLTVQVAIDELKEKSASCSEVQCMIELLQGSERGIIR